MKNIRLSGKKIGNLFWILVWILVFSVPYFHESSRGEIKWPHLLKNWIHLFGYLLIFLLNVYLLAPKLLLRKKYLRYFISIICLIILFAALDFAVRPMMDFWSVSPESLHRNHFRKPPPLMLADFIILSFLVTGAGSAVLLLQQWLKEEKRREDAEKEQLRSSLSLLKQQISPHFFLNTLNNIHALIELNPATAQDAVVRLSTLMHYLLYETTERSIELRKEIEFIRSYFSLMQLRHSEDVEVTIRIPAEIPEVKIPPLLFVSLLENAFKHGTDYPRKSFIHFEMRWQNKALSCVLKNSKRKSPPGQIGEYSGIGLENLRQSLQLLFDADFTLNIFDREDEFEVFLRIPL